MGLKILKGWMDKNLVLSLLMGFSSGLPYLLTLRTLQAWMTEEGVHLETIGLFSMVSLPYSLKFLWAPLVDRYTLKGWGRRRGWLFVSQMGVILSLIVMSLCHPKEYTFVLALVSLTVAFFSATQDIVIDAYRRESLPDHQLALGATYYVYGYRIGMWMAGGLALGLADFLNWPLVYLLMASLMGVGILTTLWAPEPSLNSSQSLVISSLREAVIAPFWSFLNRPGALWILLFVLLYKVGDTMAGQMFTPFYLKMGYTKVEIATIAKTLSLPVSLLGGFCGGLFVLRFGIFRGLWAFGIAQMLSTLAFSALDQRAHSIYLLGGVVLFEDLCLSMATAAFVAFMGSLTDKRFTATQYALLSSLMSIPRIFLAAPSGYLAEGLGWTPFFLTCSMLHLPGVFLIFYLKKWIDPQVDL